MSVRRHFLGWDRPVAEAVSVFLAADWRSGCLDLGDVLVIVPTRQSGRRLRQHLAALADSASAGVFPPRVVLPQFLTSVERSGRRTASRVEMLSQHGSTVPSPAALEVG